MKKITLRRVAASTEAANPSHSGQITVLATCDRTTRIIVVVTAMLLASHADAQLPFGPPPVDDGFVPVGAPSSSPLPDRSSEPQSSTSKFPLADPSLVGPRYAPQETPPAPTVVTAEPAQSQGPSRPFDYPITGQPGGQVLAEAETNEQCKVFARVGDQLILGCDFLDRVDRVMEANKDRIPPQNWETQRLLLIKEVLDKMIENKLVIADARRKIPEEALPNVERQLNEEFHKNQIPKMMADAEVQTKVELERLLKEAGSSIEAQRKMFMERAIGAQWIRQSIDAEPEVTHAEMWKYYQEHLDDYRNEAKAKWQELHVAAANMPSREEAFQKIAQMGNDVVQGKAPFETVARTHSHGLTAKEGGLNEWTSKGSLKSEKLDAALFELPLNQMSPIIEDADGFYIIRVVERQPEGFTPFREAQVEIADKIKARHREQQIEDYYATLRKDIAIWTIFDDPRVAAKLPPSHR